jgi:hypothetical protein
MFISTKPTIIITIKYSAILSIIVSGDDDLSGDDV